MKSRSSWIVRIAAVAGLVLAAAWLTSSAVASEGSTLGPEKSPSAREHSSPTQLFRFQGADIVRNLLSDRAMGETDGSPFLPPGQGGAPPGRPGDRPVGGNPEPGNPPGQPEGRPPTFANNDKDKDKDKDKDDDDDDD